MFIRREVTSTAEDYRQLVRFTRYKLAVLPKIIMFIFPVLSLLVILLTVFGVLPLFVGIPLAAVIAGCIIIVPIQTKRIEDRTVRNANSLGVTRTIELDTAVMRIYGGRTHTNIEMPWQLMFAVYETDDYFFVYLKQDSVFIISKTGMQLTDIYDMRNEFIKRMQNRYYKKFRQ